MSLAVSLLMAGSVLLQGAIGQPPAGQRTITLGEAVVVSEIAPGTWLITSVSELKGFGAVESNALLLTAATDSVLIDVPATDKQTQQVLTWAKQILKRPVRAVICTHAHEDRIGGLEAAHRLGIDTYGIPLTRARATAARLPSPRRDLKHDETVVLGGTTIRVLFPGAAHSPDNIVVWVPSTKILFGGCLVKALASETIGNLADADPDSWKRALQLVQDRFPSAQVVVPGHGQPGGIELLTHTSHLLAISVR